MSKSITREQLEINKMKAEKEATQEKVAANIIAENDLDVHAETVRKNTVSDEYKILTDGKNIPHQLNKSLEVYSYFSNYKEYTHTTASLIGTLATACTAAAGRVRTFTGAFPTMYFAYIAPTASSKDPIIKGLERIDIEVNGIDGTVKNGSGIQSSGALDTILRNSTGQVVITIDEFGDILGEITDGRGSSKGTLKAPLKTLYSVNHGDTYRGNLYSDQGGKIKSEQTVVKNLAFGIVGITTKNQLLSKVKSEHLEDGTLNRYVFIDGHGHKSKSSGGYGETYIPSKLIEHLNSFEIIDEDSKIIPLTDESMIYWNTSLSPIEKESGLLWEWCSNEDGKMEAAGRVRENTLRLATALAFFNQLVSIPRWLLEWCFNFTMLSIDNFYSIFQEHDEAGDKHMEVLNKVMSWFEKRKDQEILKSKISNHCTYLRKLNSTERNKILAELVERGMLRAGKGFTYIHS